MKNVLNYFVRKAFGFKSTATAEDKTLFGHLLRIRQNIQGVYDWLYARCPADAWWLARRMPMTEAVTSADGSSGSTPVKLRPVLQNSDTLLAHLRLLDNRKISNGYQDGTPADDGLPDGVSLARLLCDSTTQPTELIDDNIGWVMDKTPTLPSTLIKLVLGCKEINNVMLRADSVAELELPYLEEFKSNVYSGENRIIFNGETLYLPKLRYYEGYYNTIAPYVGIVACGAFKNFIAPNLEGINDQSGWHDCFLAGINNETPYDRLEKVVLGKLKVFNWGFGGNHYTNNVSKQTNLLHFEIGEGTAISLNCSKWNPDIEDSSRKSLFLDNFLHFIAERVAEGNYTLTLSAAVYQALEQQEGQTILALLNTKGWTVASA